MISEAEPMVSTFRGLSLEVGRLVEAALSFVGESFSLTIEAIGFMARGRLRAGLFIQQAAGIGADSLPLCALILFFSGMVLGLNTASTFVDFGAGGYVGGVTAITIAREMGPTLVGILVAARAGSAIAAELGTMAVSEQIDALRALAVSPVRYLVVPRLAAGMVMLPLITVIAEIFGALGAFWISVQAGVPSSQFIHSASVFLTSRDLFGGLMKTVVFGLIIAIVGCRQGLRTQGGAVGVGRATISSVVISIVLILVSDYFLTALIILPMQPR